MWVDYNNIAKTFSQSRKHMKWEEIGYFIESLTDQQDISILDIWCGNGRLYWALKDSELKIWKYLWIDLSSWLLEEAKKMYPWINFQERDMVNISELDHGWSHIFFIASFHHLETLEDRLSVLGQAYDVLEPGWTIYMTNWALDSDLNKQKYSQSIISDTKNEYWSQDYSIKIWEYIRYYHWFNIAELEYLFKEIWFEIIENREFDTEKNIISIIKKPLS